MNLMNIKAVIQTPLQIIGEVVHLIKTNTIDYWKTTSLPEATKLTRVEPITVISADLANYEYTPDILQSLVNLFAGYYLQAVSLSARIGNVRIVNILDKLNPDRDASAFFVSLEASQNHRFMMADQYKYRLPRISTEGQFVDAMLDGQDLDDVIKAKQQRPEFQHSAVNRDSVKTLNEPVNLAVGKMILVDITIDEQSMQVPVNIRLAPAVLSNTSTEHLLTLKKEDNSLTERYHAWRAGRIAFIRDLMFCQDLIDTHRKALMEDKEGVYSEIIRRVNNSKKYGLLTQNPSLVSASNLFVISEEVAKTIEQGLGGKLSNARVREKAFENTYAMVIAVVDRDWERVTFYHRGVAAATNVSVKDIVKANKSKGPEVTDILSQLVKGQAPTF